MDRKKVVLIIVFVLILVGGFFSFNWKSKEKIVDNEKTLKEKLLDNDNIKIINEKITENGDIIVLFKNTNDCNVSMVGKVEYYDKDDNLLNVFVKYYSNISKNEEFVMWIDKAQIPDNFDHYKVIVDSQKTDKSIVNYNNDVNVNVKAKSKKMIVKVEKNTKDIINRFSVDILLLKNKEIVGVLSFEQLNLEDNIEKEFNSSLYNYDDFKIYYSAWSFVK